MDRDCSVWDRQIHLTVDCGATAGPVEIGRWINSFARKGHWVTTTPLASLLRTRSSTAPAICNFTTSVGNGDHWLATLKLRFPLAASASGVVDHGTGSTGRFGTTADEAQAAMMMPMSAVPIVYPNNGQGFSSKAYNTNRTISFGHLAPPGTCLKCFFVHVFMRSGSEFQ